MSTEFWNVPPMPLGSLEWFQCPWNSGMSPHAQRISGMSPHAFRISGMAPTPWSSFPVATAAAGSGFPSWMPQDGNSQQSSSQIIIPEHQAWPGQPRAFPAPGSAFGAPVSPPGFWECVQGSHPPPVELQSWPSRGESAAPDRI